MERVVEQVIRMFEVALNAGSKRRPHGKPSIQDGLPRRGQLVHYVVNERVKSGGSRIGTGQIGRFDTPEPIWRLFSVERC
jgi:hypothetical protein